MKKRAAIELSVTAIVVLILAIVILGLGLGFIRGMFGKVSTTFEQQVATEPEPPKGSPVEPITLSRESIITGAGQTEVLKVGIYNPTDSDWAIQGTGNKSFTTNVCPNIQQITISGPNYEGWRSSICTNSGCGFTNGGDNTQTNDKCEGSRTSCPQITTISLSGLSYETMRQKVCTSATGCIFANGGTGDTASGDTCTVGNQSMTTSVISIGCGTGPNALGFTSQGNQKMVPVAEYQVFNVLLEINKGQPAGTYLCEAAVGDYSKDFTVRINK